MPRMRSTSSCTSFATETVLLSGWRLMLMSTAGFPSARTMVYSGLSDWLTVATSPTRTGRPAGVFLITICAKSSAPRACPLTSPSTS